MPRIQKAHEDNGWGSHFESQHGKTVSRRTQDRAGPIGRALPISSTYPGALPVSFIAGARLNSHRNARSQQLPSPKADPNTLWVGIVTRGTSRNAGPRDTRGTDAVGHTLTHP
jgi:hypothetical protein